MAMNTQEAHKKLLGEVAVERFVRSSMSIGLGSGTTAIWAMRTLAKKYKEGNISNIVCASTGPGTTLEGLALGLPLHPLNSEAVLSFDVVIDGADEYNAVGNLVKGGGGCLLQEKIVAYTAKKFVVVAEETKQVDHLGTVFPVPIEVIPSALRRVELTLQTQYNLASITLRKDARKVGPWITEEGNYLLDIQLAGEYDVEVLELEIVQIVGVVEVGLFTRNKPIILSAQTNGNIVELDFRTRSN